ncbi:MAG TPA: helix-turn-helix domain-containing protein [Polyangiaceae bacterium]|nr:helix-turn-helix domain-containing protein [Polyangiaceae bacterium]
MPKGKPSLLEALGKVCDGETNYSVAQAALYLRCTQNKMHKLASEGRLHPVRICGHLVFARSDLERQRRSELELELTKRFMAGDHPLDVYIDLDGRAALRDVERVLHDWAKLTGIWLIEAPRGSYARWLQRFDLVRVTPRALRRFLEAMLVEGGELGGRVRAFFSSDDWRDLNGPAESATKARQARRLMRPQVA